VLSIVGVDVLYSKVVDDQGEGNVAGVMGEEAVGVLGLVVAMLV
jgi:hypothetical protein